MRRVEQGEKGCFWWEKGVPGLFRPWGMVGKAALAATKPYPPLLLLKALYKLLKSI